MVSKLARSVGVALLAVVLFVSLVGANAAIGLERTALSEDFLAESLESEGAYPVLHEQIVSTAGDNVTEAEPGAEGPAPEELLSEVMTEAYLQNQTEANLERLYAYLDGDRDDLSLYFETEALKAALTAEIAPTVLEEVDVEAVSPRFANLTDGPDAYEAERAAFEEEVKAEIQAETDRTLSEEELDLAFEDRREEIRTELINEMESKVAGNEEIPVGAESAVLDLGTVYVDGLIGAEYSYESFTSDLETAEADLETAVESAVRDQLDEEVPDEMALTEGLTAEDRETLEAIRGMTSVLGILAIVLPVFALVVAGGIWVVTATRSGGLFAIGSVTTIAGAVTVAGVSAARTVVVSEVEAGTGPEAMPADLAAVVLGILDRVLSVFSTQSWLLVGVGVVLLVAGLVIRRGLVSVADRSGEADETDAEPEGTEDDHSAALEPDSQPAPDGSEAADGESGTPEAGSDSRDSGRSEPGNTERQEPESSEGTESSEETDPETGR